MSDPEPRSARELVFTEPAMVLTSRLAFKISRAVNLKHTRQTHRDPEVRDALTVIEALALAFENARSDAGTNPASESEPRPDSITTQEAANLAHVTTRAIRKAITEKRLPAEPLGNTYMIRRDDLRTYIANRT